MNELAQVTHGLAMEGAMETSHIGSERAVTDYQEAQILPPMCVPAYVMSFL